MPRKHKEIPNVSASQSWRDKRLNSQCRGKSDAADPVSYGVIILL